MNRVHHWICGSNLWAKLLREKLMPWALDGVNLGGNVLEVGPGPGLTTELLRHRAARVTSVEIDPVLAHSLGRKLSGTNVRVIEGDATSLPFASGSFSGAVSFTMLHHVSSAVLQDRLLAEVCRVLEPGATFAGTDSTWSFALQLFHLFDTLVAVDPDTFSLRLEAAGFSEPWIDEQRGIFRFRARK
jgi:SAM-dependent methyltransferase